MWHNFSHLFIYIGLLKLVFFPINLLLKELNDRLTWGLSNQFGVFFYWNFAGDSGIAVCISTIINLWNSRVFNGSIWMDTCQVPPLPFLPLFHTLSLHVLGHVDGCPYPKCSSCCNYIISCLWNLESIRRLFGSTSSKLFFPSFLVLPNHFKKIVFELFDAKKASWVDHTK